MSKPFTCSINCGKRFSHASCSRQEIGGELFTYERRHLKPSPLGRELIPLAEDLLATHDQIRNIRSNQEVKGVVRVAAPESLTISRLSPIIREFSLKYPHVKFILTNGTCEQNQVDLISGRVDVALMVYPEIHPEKCIHYSLVKENIVLVCNNDGPDHFDEYKRENTNHCFITNEEGILDKDQERSIPDYGYVLVEIIALASLFQNCSNFSSTPRRLNNHENCNFIFHLGFVSIVDDHLNRFTVRNEPI